MDKYKCNHYKAELLVQIHPTLRAFTQYVNLLSYVQNKIRTNLTFLPFKYRIILFLKYGAYISNYFALQQIIPGNRLYQLFLKPN